MTGENPAGSKFVRRQTAVGRAMPAGSSRDERLDPFTLPVRFAATRQGGRRARAHRRADPGTGRGSAGGARHQDGGQPSGHRLSRCRAPDGAARRRNGRRGLDRARASRPRSFASPFQRRRRHGHRGRMAVVGARARHAAPGRRSGRTLARSVRPHRRPSRRHPHLAATKAHGDQEAAAVHPAAAQGRAARSRAPPCITSARSSRGIAAGIQKRLDI